MTLVAATEPSVAVPRYDHGVVPTLRSLTLPVTVSV